MAVRLHGGLVFCVVLLEFLIAHVSCFAACFSCMSGVGATNLSVNTPLVFDKEIVDITGACDSTSLKSSGIGFGLIMLRLTTQTPGWIYVAVRLDGNPIPQQCYASAYYLNGLDYPSTTCVWLVPFTGANQLVTFVCTQPPCTVRKYEHTCFVMIAIEP